MSVTIQAKLVCYSCPASEDLELLVSLGYGGAMGLELPRDWRRFGNYSVLCPTCSKPIRDTEPRRAPTGEDPKP